MSESDDFKMVSVGMYDDLIECKKCGYRCCVSADAPDAENEERKQHTCVPKT